MLISLLHNNRSLEKKRLGAVRNGALLIAAAVLLAGCSSSGGNTHKGHGSSSAPDTDKQAVTASVPAEYSASGAAEAAPWVATKNTTRINASNPVQAAVLVSRTLWPAQLETGRPGAVILTDPTDWAGAAAAAHLIHHPHNGPVLYTDAGKMPDVTLQELLRLNPTGISGSGVQVILVGKIDKDLEKAVQQRGFKTARVEGRSAAELAAAADAYYISSAGETPPGVIVGSSDEQSFTIPAAYWSAHMPEPLLYISGNSIPDATAQALQKRGGKASIYIIGPEKAVSAQIEKQLQAYGKVTRIAGGDPFENAIAFAEFKDESTGFGWGINAPGRNLTFANADEPALALAGAPFAHLGKHAPLIWTDKEAMPDAVMNYVMSLQPRYDQSPADGPFNHAWLIGGDTRLTGAAQAELDAMLEIASPAGGGHEGH
ncbi:cell wall-binding repeat-containing protein [Paenibacillus pasadenensis]|uniref:cell wall-binding repeat-containing protein n=1 Tax=Paenibacillus pasadenensis TaxID=217090 RepID=UPI00203EA581|nr:cell wall-binding repeat-containing protein [Paenibacillus pasadenensis]MCM3746495.1 cell wall-binding repeat-containing protein [Paenibacillus pasadenensis]